MNNSRETAGGNLSEQMRLSMFTAKSLIVAVALGAAFPAASATDRPSLRDVPEIENIIFVAALAHEISDKCPSIKARKMKALGMAWRLRSRANELGYSDKEIRAYVESGAEKSRMRTKGETYLKAHGIDYNNPESFCVFGRAEIANSSAVGALLKAN
ncbi:MAG: hypothetical protein ACI9BH_002873 [Paracoccaceae bacterium]